MVTRTFLLLILTIVPLLGGCEPCEQPAQSAQTPDQALAAMDNRTPVPLLPMMALHQKQNMQDHLLAVQEIVAALAVEDYAAVQKAAARIASSPQNEQMCTHMGAGADGFAQQGIQFHTTADSIAAAAAAGDRAATLQALGDTLATCTDCHSRYRQELVTQAQWQERTGSVIPAGPLHGQ